MALTLHGTVADNTVVLDRRSAKPLIINGDMQVAQRATSVTGSTTGGYTTVDRMSLSIGTLGTWTIAQTASAPDNTGLTNSYRLDCTTADASPAAGDYAIFNTRLEGQDVQLFKKGTSYAEKMTVSFWVKSNKTGTYIMELDDNDNTRNINQAYTISSANTWEKKVLSFAGDTTGAFDNDNGDSLRLLWWLGSGSDFSSGSLQTAWASTTNANRAVGNVNLADSTDNDWSITGIQLEVGEFDANSIAPFQHESFGDNLARCQRYYFMLVNENSKNFAAGGYYNANLFATNIPFPVTMRSAPSVDKEVGSNFYNILANNTADACDDFALVRASTTCAGLDFTTNVSGTQGHGGVIATGSASAQIAFESEL